jgi:hypothetical protein
MDTTLHALTSRRPGAARIATGATLGVIGLLLLAAGIAGSVTRTSSDGGYVSTGTHPYASSGRAIVTDAMHVGAFPDWLVARLRVRASSDNRSSWASVAAPTSTGTSPASRTRRSRM